MPQAAVVESMSGFYVAGGNLTPDAGSYVVRPADTELYNALRAGEYAYVLTSRQMGKSSLMHRTAMRLQAAGVRSVLLDLTSVGANLSVDQWYFGLLAEIGGQLGLRDDTDRYWTENSQHGPLFRFAHALTDVVLAKIPEPLVIFIDEIDFVRGLRFSPDEFFASIRRFFNGRAADPSLNRLTFCLLGVATPAYLISDVNTTPFNIGRQIELTDFTAKEAALLARGFAGTHRDGKRKLSRILYWTGGHPYLTQKLCLAAAQRELRHPREIDRLCREMFLASHARTSEDNLIFVHNKLRGGAEDAATVITMYRKILAGKRVDNDPADPVVAQLRLCGVVRAVNGRLVRRNRIYSRVFGRQWVLENMPEADLRRERAAYRRGFALAVVISTLVFAIMGVLIFRATTALRSERHMLCIQDISLAQAALDNQQLNRAIALLAECRSVPGEQFAKRFEWRWLWHECHPHERILPVATRSICALRFTPDGSRLVAVSEDRAIWIVDIRTGTTQRKIDVPFEPMSAAIAPACDSVAFVALSNHQFASWICSLRTGKLQRLQGQSAGINALAFSRDGRFLVGCGVGGTMFWNAAAGLPVRSFAGPRSFALSVDISPDSRYVAVASVDGMVREWNVQTGRLTFDSGDIFTSNEYLSFSPDGSILAAAGLDGVIRLFQTAHPGSGMREFEQDEPIENLAFSPTGDRIVTCSRDLVDRIWRVSDGSCLLAVSGHSMAPQTAQFSPDGATIAAGDVAGEVVFAAANPPAQTARINGEVQEDVEISPATGNVITESEIGKTIGDTTRVSAWSGKTGALLWSHSFSSDRDRPSLVALSGNCLVLATVGAILAYDARTGALLHTVAASVDSVYSACAALSCDGRFFAVYVAPRHQVIVYDLAARNRAAELPVSDVIYKLAFSPDGRHLAGAVRSGYLDVWSVPSMTREISLRTAGANNYGITDDTLCFSRDGRTIAVDHRGRITVYRTADWTRESVIEVAPLSPVDMAFSVSGRSIAVGSDDGSITFWDVAFGRETIAMHGHTGKVLCTAFNAGGTSLITVGVDRVIRRWSTT
ncbi:MAG: AAA-like domain-containing protein [Capsulimonadaceae bacterium]